MEAFLDVIQQCEFIDLGFLGSRFTWSNMKKGFLNVQKLLGQGLG